ncbi:hypothetical protein GCM10007973_21870 [Polymorphobacter multimanifer]|uniref:PEP-CTERM sorting domain-containing protein n=1 Tax=Polymorphobacter multimanifer TaxID=1070431 RepID=A0A841L8N2_9SPHN|nr:hypothetical protein [Polymorphobacter multimanifer]MBB6227941.1 hypothetical protein [Polymorphobacter multimanifer]GGI84882.1 hypothetical protein GCM10007973_21870 [Polymorphobacter multimanifer]
MIRTPLAAATLALSGLAIPSASFATTTISTSAFTVFTDLRDVTTEGLSIGPIAKVEGTTSPGYDLSSAGDVSITQILGPVGTVIAGYDLVTGAGVAVARANGTTPFDTSFGSGGAAVGGVRLDVSSALVGMQANFAVTLRAATIASETTVTRIGDVATLTGTSTFSNLDLAGPSPFTLNLGANAQIDPNFVAFDAGGLRIILNEQTLTGNGTTSQSLVTNAIRIVFSDYILGDRAITGDVIFAQSRATIDILPSAVIPEPAVWLQLIAGFGLAGLIVRRRRTAPQHQA